MRTGLKTEVADQASDHPAIPLELVRDDVEIALQPLARCESFIVERFADQSFQVVEVLVEHFQSEGLFRPKMVGK